MSEESTGLGQRAKSLVSQAKQSVGAGDPPLATEAGGRAEGMSEALKAFGEGDIDRFLSAFAEDVEWSGPKGDGFPGAGNHQGRDAVREAFVGDAERSYASFGFRPDRYLETPGENLVVALGAFIGEAVKGDGGPLDAPAVQVWEYDGDKVVFVGIYTDSAAFPGVVTEKEQEERKKEQEGEDDEDGAREDDEPKDRQDGGDEKTDDKDDKDDKDDEEARERDSS